MSFRIPFNKFHQSKKSAISKTSEREFEREVRKLDTLEEKTKKIHKDMKRCTESQAAQSKCEADISVNLLTSALYRDDEKLRELVDQWTVSTKKLELLMEELNATSHKAVTEPMKKFATIFPAIQTAIRKREQALQEYNKCVEKMDKYSKRERTGPNVVKLENSRQAYAVAKQAYDEQNELLMVEVPRLYEGRITYFQPSLQALIKAQIFVKYIPYTNEAMLMHQKGFKKMKYYTDSQATYADLCRDLGGRNNDSLIDESSAANIKHSIQQRLTEIRALSITADDQPIS